MRKMLLFLSAVAALVSCREELCYNHFGSAVMEFRWDAEPESGNVPAGITALVYGNDSEFSGESYLSPSGGGVNFGKNGVKCMLFYNNDTERIIISGEADGPFAVRATSTYGTRAAPADIRTKFPDDPVLNPPDMLYSAFVDSIPDVGKHEVSDLQVKMRPMVCSYRVRYEFEYGGHRVVLARGAISGMARMVGLHDGSTPSECATFVYDCEVADSDVVADMMSFGTPGYPVPSRYAGGGIRRIECSHILNLEVKLVNGKTKEFYFDITDQLAGQPRGGEIVVSGLRIEDNDSSGDSGFDVDLGGWGDHEDIDLPVGGQQGA